MVGDSEGRAGTNSDQPQRTRDDVSRSEDVRRIHEGLNAAAEALMPFTPGDIAFERKETRGDPVTAADEAADRVLREILPREGEGWLSEESVDDPARLSCERVWVVDPIDGTREFVEGIPEWCISIGLLEGGLPVAGGIFNPVTGQLVLGSLEGGVTLNGQAATVTEPPLDGPITVLASRSEIRRGEWDRFENGRFDLKPCGSVAFKLGLVAAGLADATWTLVGKSEWDVVAGTALVRAAGGLVCLADGSEPGFNKPRPVFPNYVAAGRAVGKAATDAWLRPHGSEVAS
jgi:myo-inositol-1(or 4)-monophosphatase